MLKNITPIPQELKSARIAKGISQRELAAKVGMPQSHLSKIESGSVNIQLTSLIEISRVLEFELMLVPRKKIALVKELVSAESSSAHEKESRPAYTLDDESEGEDENG